MHYTQTNEIVFAEGDPGNCIYVLYHGSIGIFKYHAAANAGQPRTKERMIAVYRHGSERPWFGELAIWNGKPRSATAKCLEPSVLLLVRSEHFGAFLDIVPQFEEMFEASTNAFATLNVLMHHQQVDSPT